MNKKMMKNKKGEGFFLPILAVCVLIVTAALCISLTIKFSKTTNLGEHQLAIISTMNEGEKIQLYIEESARIAAQKAYEDTNMNGGIPPDLCEEEYLGYPLIDQTISCAETTGYFEKQFKKRFTQSLNQHEEIKNYYAYDMDIDSSKTNTKITGTAVTNLIIPITDYSKYANTQIINTLTNTQTGLTSGINGENYLKALNDVGIKLNHDNIPCQSRTQPDCTSLEGIKPQIIENIIRIKKDMDTQKIKCDIIITGGSEQVGHSKGSAHYDGRALDIRDMSCFGDFIKNNAMLKDYGVQTVLITDSMKWQYPDFESEGAGDSHFHLTFKVS